MRNPDRRATWARKKTGQGRAIRQDDQVAAGPTVACLLMHSLPIALGVALHNALNFWRLKNAL
jgi:hypothetical protein